MAKWLVIGNLPGSNSISTVLNLLLITITQVHIQLFIPLLFLKALASNSRNFTVQLQCLLPFVPLRELIEVLDGETFLRDMSLYRDLPWSPQQVHIHLHYASSEQTTLHKHPLLWLWYSIITVVALEGKPCSQCGPGLPLICKSLVLLQMSHSGY